jgi:hypothetical protein
MLVARSSTSTIFSLLAAVVWMSVAVLSSRMGSRAVFSTDALFLRAGLRATVHASGSRWARVILSAAKDLHVARERSFAAAQDDRLALWFHVLRNKLAHCEKCI